MRLQILELPSIVVGENVQTPFVLVFDGDVDAIKGDTAFKIKQETGATGVIVSPVPIEIVR